MRTRHKTPDLATGGARSRDMARIAMRSVLFERDMALEADGCLDAPDTLPAGSCNSVDWTDWRGNPLAGQSETAR